MSPKPFGLAVKAVVVDDQNRMLLLRRSAANRNFIGKWEWPGGKVDEGEDFATAVVRESEEETGLAVEITDLAGATRFEMPALHVVLLCMEARAHDGEIRLSQEHDEFAWVAPADLDSYDLVDQVADFMLDYAKRRREM
jgi:8-oxo-dGTP diphosphatase